MAIPLLLSTLVIVMFSSETSNLEPLSDAKVSQLDEIPIVGAIGPESFAFDPLARGPYAGISDGRVVKWEEHGRRWINFSFASQERYCL